MLLGHTDDRSVVHYVTEDASNVIGVRRRLERTRFAQGSSATKAAGS